MHSCVGKCVNVSFTLLFIQNFFFFFFFFYLGDSGCEFDT